MRLLLGSFGLLAVGAILLVACVPAGGTAPAGSPSAASTAVPGATPGIGGTQGTPSASPLATPGGTTTAGVPTASLTPPTPPAGQAGCPNLESRLYGLTGTGDPADYAANNQLYYAAGRVRAVIELQSADAALPAGYDLSVETRNGNLVQALIPVKDLCRLSNEPQVRFIRAPYAPVR